MEKYTEIQNLLNTIEQEQGVRILLAVESGSRAWGFPSSDSDFDIRLIYCHPVDRYLTAFPKRDVIENVFVGDLDAAGWDLQKCLQLMAKGNAVLHEWLYSPMLYRADAQALDALRLLSQQAFNPRPAFHHYLSLAKKKLSDERTAAHSKSFLYALRALLCAQWIADRASVPPVAFQDLQDSYVAEGAVAEALQALMADKSEAIEAQVYPVASLLTDFAHSLYESLQSRQPAIMEPVSTEEYDRVFRELLGA